MDSIKDMKCPVCGCAEKFEIEIGTTLVIYNSDDEFTWKAGSDCECGDDACDFNGTVADFLGAQAATEPGQHTPGPWELKKGGHEYWYITANKGESQVALIGVMTVAPRAPEANARRIVLAVNCHDELLDMLKAVEARISIEQQEHMDDPAPGTYCCGAIHIELLALIAKAEGI